MRVSVIPSWPLSRRLRELQVKIHNVTGSTAYTVLSKIRSKKTIRQSTCKTTCMIKIFMSSVNLSDCQTCRMTQTGKKKAGHVLVYKRTGETYSTYLGPTISDGDDCCFLQPPYLKLRPPVSPHPPVTTPWYFLQLPPLRLPASVTKIPMAFSLQPLVERHGIYSQQPPHPLPWQIWMVSIATPQHPSREPWSFVVPSCPPFPGVWGIYILVMQFKFACITIILFNFMYCCTYMVFYSSLLNKKLQMMSDLLDKKRTGTNTKSQGTFN